MTNIEQWAKIGYRFLMLLTFPIICLTIVGYQKTVQRENKAPFCFIEINRWKVRNDSENTSQKNTFYLR